MYAVALKLSVTIFILLLAIVSSEKYRTRIGAIAGPLEKSISHRSSVRLTVQVKFTSNSEQVSNLRIGLPIIPADSCG